MSKTIVSNGSVDTVIRNAKVVTAQGVMAGGIGVRGGKIVCIGKDEILPASTSVIDAGGKYLLPGLIDPHTHLGVGRSFADDTRSETLAAAAGGITTMLTMVNPDIRKAPGQPITILKDIIEKEASIDVGLTFIIVTEAQALQIPEYADQLGVISFKLYLSYRDPAIASAIMLHPIKSVPERFDDGLVYLTLEKAAEVGGVVSVHAESWEVSRIFYQRLVKSGAKGLRAWADKSPGFVEALDVRRVALLSEVTGCCVYIVHVTAKEALEEVRRAKRDGVNIIGETCPHYLGIIDVDAPFPGSLAKVNPPVRDREHSERLWEGIKDGIIDCIGSDHIVYLLGDRRPDANIWTSDAAFSGMELTLPLMYTEGVDKGRISLEKLVEICCTNPAKAFGLYPKKGAIQVGADADIVIIDIDKVKKVVPKELQQFSDFSIYEGLELKGWPTLTMLRGIVVMKDGKIVGERQGRYLHRKANEKRR